jgi:hypothetical protein
MLFGDRFYLPVVLADAIRERADLLQDGPEGRHERLRNVSGRFVVEAPCGALGQAGPEGLDRSLGTWFTSWVRLPTNACLERIKAIWA